MTNVRRKSISYRQQKYTMTDREGLKSTISLGHGQSRGTGRSSILGDYNPTHEPLDDEYEDRMNNRMEEHRAGGGSFNLGQRREP
jgi:hypothetical protein